MKLEKGFEQFYIGWDVGGWNCEKNGKSRDAIVILDDSLTIVGTPWRGNLRVSICGSSSTVDWLAELFALCKLEFPGPTAEVTMAIDAPLGFPSEFVALATDLQSVDSIDSSSSNRYLFRLTERRLFSIGWSPLSAVKDMLGSQATKGMHVLSRFAPVRESCGVWTDGSRFHAIETYPTACRDSPIVRCLLGSTDRLNHIDLEDARTCALISHLFAVDRSSLEEPPPEIPLNEGWIWIPKQEA